MVRACGCRCLLPFKLYAGCFHPPGLTAVHRLSSFNFPLVRFGTGSNVAHSLFFRFTLFVQLFA